MRLSAPDQPTAGCRREGGSRVQPVQTGACHTLARHAGSGGGVQYACWASMLIEVPSTACASIPPCLPCTERLAKAPPASEKQS